MNWRPNWSWRPRLPVEALLSGAVLFGGAFWLSQTMVRLVGGTTPPLAQLAPADPQSAAGSAAQAHWFGDASVAAPVAAPPLKVIGVLSGPASQAFAIVEENGQKLPLLVGKSTPGGWTLVQVNPTGVVLNRPGSSDKVEVPLVSRDAAPAPAPAPGAPGGFAPVPGTGFPPPQEAGQPSMANPAVSTPAPIPSPDNVVPPPSH